MAKKLDKIIKVDKLELYEKNAQIDKIIESNQIYLAQIQNGQSGKELFDKLRIQGLGEIAQLT